MNKPTEFKTYLAEYEYDGNLWVTTIEAESEEDAKYRLLAAHTGKIQGVAYSKVPHKLGWFAKAYVWAANLLRRGGSLREIP